ncbi:hypothetical protein [Paracerasibacillus soli]|uniref:Transposase n=1 Tax=Paracerasibacillus soli TaxID=480284 RepID=A0ABU5CUR2_9BACI|nr:hypothetical protein [Virgibacillus soli]MDY0409559.1 hypothetical protein [Virgibacillus soli]
MTNPGILMSWIVPGLRPNSMELQVKLTAFVINLKRIAAILSS